MANPEDNVVMLSLKQRASYKGQLTSFANYLKTVSSLTALSASELQLRLAKIRLLYEKFDEVQLAIECHFDNIPSQVNERITFETPYFKYLAQAEQLLSEFYQSEKDSKPKKDPSTNSSSTNSGNQRLQRKLVKLPTIQLPKFNGSYSGWLEFRDTFTSLIHSCDEIEDINKFHYLRASLEGTAVVVIQSLEFSAVNYSVAWKLLCDWFDNKRLLVQNHVTALFNIEPMAKESSVTIKRLIDQLNRNLRALETLGEPTKHWDTLLIYIVSQKLDSKTNREWEEYKSNYIKDKITTLGSFFEFLRGRADLLETLEMSNGKSNSPLVSTTKGQSNKIKTMVVKETTKGSGNSTISTPKPCPKCNGDHFLGKCSQFLALSNSARLHLLPNFKICFNCFRDGHYANHCKKTGCKVCRRKHNTLVHVSEQKTSPTQPVSDNENNSGTADKCSSSVQTESSDANNLTLSASLGKPSQTTDTDEVLLSTVLIKVQDRHRRFHIVRAVLDSGSTSSLITEKLQSVLDLPTINTDRSVQGINSIMSHISQACRLTIVSMNDDYKRELCCFILPSITENIPSRQVNLSSLNIPSNLRLADPNFYSPGAIQMLIGADVFWDILGTQNIRLGVGKPILHETRLGWLVSGPINSGSVSISSAMKCNFTKVFPGTYDSNDDIQNQMTRFWQLDEVCSQSSMYSGEEKLCEEHFVKHTSRLEDGRFCVRIPLKQSPDLLGNSFNRAKACLLCLERRFKSQKSLHKMYVDFMSEYESLNHMSELNKNDVQVVSGHFIPHHGVLRESSATTKLRAVFNASSLTSSGVSYNSIQMVGPTVQDDLLSILLRFRQHKFVLAADIEKHYRQIAVHPDDRYLQQVIWRDDPLAPMKFYQLNTVTYGTASAPFLATRCLKQIALDCQDSKIAEIIDRDFYVDDLLTGGDNLEEVLAIRKKVTTELASACMHLRKWKSNCLQLVSDDQASVNLIIGGNEPSKTLGLGWLPGSDNLIFPSNNTSVNHNTKRSMLSIISQIFDPLGILAPYVINMKILMQKLWLLHLSWDDQLPTDISNLWQEILSSMTGLDKIRIPRWVSCDLRQGTEIHVFSDASETAYGACAYLLSINENSEVTVRLLLAKGRVAPLKPITLPKLEMCGALTGVRIYNKLLKSLRMSIDHAYFWTDSTIVLGWLKVIPIKLQTFVRNRVGEILEHTGDRCTWNHVPTYENPADFISRGVNIDVLHSLQMWWEGPAFLKQPKVDWPSVPHENDILPELKQNVSLIANTVSNENILFDRFSDYLRMIRTVAYMIRFIKSCRKENVSDVINLTATEIKSSSNALIKISQSESFPEYQLLLNKKELPRKSSLLKFNVFLDSDNILRVGGRLDNSKFSYNKKHPILIQSTHRFTSLLFNYEHKKLLHAGPQLLLSTIRETFWPIGGRNLAKSCVRKCVRCRRFKGQIVAPLMGNLPEKRVSPGGCPFEAVGVDYAGPINSLSRQGRGSKLVKVYIVIFVCFATKAMHLELVGDLTSNTYLLALKRFIARRGKPRDIYSDNGTSFVGAYNDIKRFIKDNSNSIVENAANDGINFHFIPAYSPHYGGLWEAGVRSCKHHLVRVLGNCHLTYEELSTTLTQIEAVLNSRPLSPLSSSPEDFTPLTPGHFIIGRPLTSLATPDFQDRPSHSLSRFHRIEQLRQHFWSRWSKEYVSELQLRVKWRASKSNLKVDDLVLLKEDNLPPLRWKLGRIVNVYPGTDGIVRVAEVKTSSGVVRRAFSKICPLLEADQVVG